MVGADSYSFLCCRDSLIPTRNCIETQEKISPQQGKTQTQTRARARAHTHTHTDTQTHTQTKTHTDTDTQTHTPHIHTHTQHTDTHTQTKTHTDTDTQAHTHTYTHTHNTQTHRHTHTHIYIYKYILHMERTSERAASGLYCTGLFKMIVGVLTTCHTQYTSDSSICIFYLIEQHSKVLLHTLKVLYMCTLCDSTNINTIIQFVPNCL